MILYLRREFLTVDSDFAFRALFLIYPKRIWNSERKEKNCEKAECLEYAIDVKINL